LKLLIVKTCADLVKRYGTKIHLLGLHFKDSFFDLYKYYSFDNSNSFNFARPGSKIVFIFDGEKLRSYSIHQLSKERKVRYKVAKPIYQIVFENILAYAKKLEREG
jgi:glycyl-tRNA synthetase beta subunit